MSSLHINHINQSKISISKKTYGGWRPCACMCNVRYIWMRLRLLFIFTETCPRVVKRSSPSRPSSNSSRLSEPGLHASKGTVLQHTTLIISAIGLRLTHPVWAEVLTVLPPPPSSCLLSTGRACCDIKGRVCCSSTGRLPVGKSGPHPVTWKVVRHYATSSK